MTLIPLDAPTVLPLLETTPGPLEDVALLEQSLLDETEPDLWYRDHDSGEEWVQLHTIRDAEGIVLSRTDRNPWATIMRIEEGENGEPYRWSVFEILGSHDRVFVCGDLRTSDSRWFWSSWPEGHQDPPKTVLPVGPPWYRAAIWSTQIVTANDAIVQLVPALHAQLFVERQTPGFVWRDRRHDHPSVEHLRSPIT